MKRTGFTMIELIFVIVILGILAAVAIPKLAATRDDAKIAKEATQIATAVSDIGAYYTSKGTFAEAGEMSNVFAGSTVDLNSTTSVTFSGAPCISVFGVASVSGGSVDGIDVRYTYDSTNTLCTGIASAAGPIVGKAAGWTATSDANLTHTFGGTGVVY